ncbi:glycosyltransferase family 2 protein [Thermophilibacter provencensis]|jgi:glycosyltransferase involved in cell wall biosynthesis|uniref:glycosyltransferase family 2 protein n=1 Tax=Thermophilibacter provencensis TaxID=1852386 RepID=UPI002355F7F0|nr:glycosyltransferase family 2 protein [Thermophilibacter provencensis]
MPKLVSVVIPCYNSERSIAEVVELTMAEFAKLDSFDCEFVLVDDNSSDGTFAEITRLCERYPNVHGLSLMRNFGQHNGLMCAMNHVSGDYVLGMDDDMQTHPSQIAPILAKMGEGYDLVYGVYRKSTNGSVKNLTSWLNKKTSRVLLGRPKDIQSSNFWCITRQVCDEVIKYKNYSPYVDGIFYRVTHNIGNVTIEHHEREYGQSGYTLKKLIKQWMAYFNFSVIPLRIASVIGVVSAVVGFVMALVTVIRKLLDPTMLVGWASTISLMVFFFGLVLMVLGIIGEYVGDLVLAVNGTPQYIVRKKVNL